MNLRQKNKKLKRELEFYKNRVFRANYMFQNRTDVKVDTLQYKQHFSISEYNKIIESIGHDELIGNILDGLACTNNLATYIQIEEHQIPGTDDITITARLKVLDPMYGKE